jgi:hypothetical protein
MPPLPRKVLTISEHLIGSTREERAQHPTWRKLHKRMMRESLAYYVTEVLRGPQEAGGRFLLGPHHVGWSDAARTEHRILSLAARDHGKSFFWCFGYPLWMADRKAPGKIGYIFSAKRDLAAEHLEKIRAELIGGGENGGPNPRLQHLLPFRRESAYTLKFANGSEIRARGFDTRVRGGHPWWIVADDVGNDEWIWSETVRNKSVDKFLSAIRPMVVPGGQMIVVGTPFHAQDLYKFLEQTGTYHVMKHPALNRKGEPLWPARYDAQALERTRKELGSALRFSREYLCQPISDEASLFPTWLFETPGIKQPYSLGLGADYWRQMGCQLFMGVDLAMSASAGADFLVAYVIAVDPQGNRWIVDIYRAKGLGYQDQVNRIIQLSKKYQCGLVFCEANQYQRVITDMVISVSSVPIKAFYTHGRRKATTFRLGMNQQYSANKNALDQGVPALRMLFENGKLRIPWNQDTREQVQVWIDEMQSFGWADGKLQGVGAHDDTVMALWMADQAARVGESINVAFDEPVDDLAEDPVDEFADLGAADDEDEWKPIEGVGHSGVRW